MQNALGLVAIFFAVLSAVGVIEFGINAMFFLNTTSQLVGEGETVEFTKVFANWARELFLHGLASEYQSINDDETSRRIEKTIQTLRHI